MRRRRARWAVAVVAALALAGCSSALSGSGHLAEAPAVTAPSTAETPTPAAPSASSPSRSTAPNPLACPHVSYAAGRLSFPCIVDALTPLPQADPVWTLSLAVRVEPGWAMNEGARPVESLSGRSLPAVAEGLRTRMVAGGEYGPDPGVRTVQGRSATVAGVPAYVLETEFAVNPGYREANGLHVQVERMWIVVLSAGDGQVASWYVSVPDDVRQLWPKVPGLIASLGLI
jgi:hypothetical protein